MTATAWARRAGLALIVPALAVDAACGSCSGPSEATAGAASSSTGSVAPPRRSSISS